MMLYYKIRIQNNKRNIKKIFKINNNYKINKIKNNVTKKT